MAFSENLKRLRKQNNLKQEDLAEILHVSQQAIAKWEQEKSYPRSEMLPKIASALNCKIEDLY